MASEKLPPCGLYRTTRSLGDVPAGRLVYFHNHGDPGPGVYLPGSWRLNRARFEPRGFTLPEPVDALAASLHPLPPEGFYRVARPFFCCEKRCAPFDTDLLVQLGYNGEGRALLFLPQITAGGLSIPEQGWLIDDSRLGDLVRLKVAGPPETADEPPPVLH